MPEKTLPDQSKRDVTGSQTNISRDVQGSSLSGQFEGSVATYGDAVDLRGSICPIIKPVFVQSPAPRIPLQKPLRVPHFIGREMELGALLSDLQPGRVVTICGPGGMGKTALATEVTWQLAPGNEPPERFPDGIVFHTFYHKPQAALALEAIARAFDIDPRSGSLEAARHALKSRQALIVLDGTEAADDLTDILSIIGTCGVLITTRRHSDAPADFSDLAPLPLPQAIQLMQSWAGGMASDQTACRRICSLLGCLPLGIFLAGRYMAQRSQTSAEYLAWLEKTPLVALDLGEKQHQSIPLLMKHSLAQISPLARDCLGITGGLALKSFEPKIIACALGISVERTNRSLGKLVDYGLLRRTNTNYQITHALIHTYAREQLTPINDALLRLAHYYIDFIEEQTKLGCKGYTKLDDHRAHILAMQSACSRKGALEIVRKLAWSIDEYLKVQGHWIERATVVEAGLSAARTDRIRCDEGSFLNLLGVAYKNLGKTQDALRLYEEALAIYQDIGNRQGEASVLDNIGIAYKNLGKTRDAIGLYEGALAIYRDIGNRKGEAKVLDNIGIAHKNLGETRDALRLYEEALAIYRDIGNRGGEARVLNNTGIAYRNLGNTEKAIEFCQQAFEIAREIGDRRIEGNALGNLGIAHSNLGQDRKAIELSKEALTIILDARDRRGEGYALSNLGLAYADLGETEVAIELFEQCLTIARDIGDQRGEEYALGNLGLAYNDLGEIQKAIEFFQQALAIAREIGDRRWEGIILSKLSLCSIDIPNAQMALDIIKKIGDRRQEGYALNNLGLIYAELGDAKKAIKYYEQQLAITREVSDLRGEANALWNTSLTLEKLNERKKAIDSARAALRIYEQIESPLAETVSLRLAKWTVAK